MFSWAYFETVSANLSLRSSMISCNFCTWTYGWPTEFIEPLSLVNSVWVVLRVCFKKSFSYTFKLYCT